jgi:hypothetical protein
MKPNEHKIFERIRELRKKGIDVDVLGASDKVVARNRAEKFITTHHPNIPESKKESFIKILCEFQLFLKGIETE